MNTSRRYTEVVSPAVEPVTVALLKTHCRIDISDDDAYVTTLGKAARQYVEQITCRKLIHQTHDVYYDSFGEMVLPYSPLASISSIQYYDANGSIQTVPPAVYEAGENLGVPYIRLKYGETWPSPRGQEDGIICRCVFGYGAAAASVPEQFVHAIKLLVGHWYENREPVNIGNIINPIPMTVDHLLASYRIHYPIC